MRIFIGLILSTLGLIVILYGHKQHSRYSIISKWLFDPPCLNEKYEELGRQLQKWTIGGLLIYFGLMLILSR